MKCPDRELLSAFYDKEVPSPYMEAIAEHVASCPACAAQLASFGKLSGLLCALDEAEVVPATKDGILEFCEKKLVTMPQRVPARFSLPVLAAAAAFALFLGVGLSLALLSGRGKETMASTPQSNTVSSYSMAEVVDYLSKQQATRVIELPGTLQVENMGQPVIVREADFQKGGK